jgi:hypothetical protein
MTLLQAITILINWRGDGLSNYEASFSTYLIKTTLGLFCLIQQIFQGQLTPPSPTLIPCCRQPFPHSTSWRCSSLP